MLYLDDEESLVFLATRLLERLGYRVSGYTCAEEALAAVRADPGQFDLVVPITDEMRAAAAEAGVRELMYKPNTVEELCAAVQRSAGALKRS